MFLGFWIVLTERLTISSTIVGFIIAVIIYIYVKDAYKGIKIIGAVKQIPLWILFLLQLVGAIIIANFQVAIIVLSKNMPIKPEIVTYKTQVNSDLLKTILANAITLTPGTMTVDIAEDKLRIHCLNQDYANALDGNIFEKTLLRIQGGTHD